MVGNFHSNDDLFPDDKAREVAERAYPLISFALHHEAATNLFRTIDAKAKHAKRRFGILGLLVVALAFFSLSLAAIEPGLLAPAELRSFNFRKLL
uniref:Uncharacterized protein n=1 Tax=Candidatus Kentrum sp. FW TaxID=2126338 RepID=A0A450SZ70_9GAMM|nr:MAG: hypothetical protein BECKFW1821A_GA0114235_109119 [Candidatus Kentron sp. FW]